MSKLYFGWTEECDWEGETWTLWLPVQGNEPFIEWFKEQADEDQEYQEDGSESMFALEPEYETAAFVTKLCNRRSRTSYMDENTMEDMVVNLPALLAALEAEKSNEYPETLDGLLYKMKIRDYLVEVKNG